jgi:carboxyl-terminal processing protease
VRPFTLLMIFLTGCVAAFAQIAIPNNDFEQFDASSDTHARNWRCVGSADHCSIDTAVTWRGRYALHLALTDAGGKVSVDQDMPFNCRGLSKYRISGAIRTRDVRNQFAGIGARVFDKDGNTIAGYPAFKVRGTQEWKIYEGEFYADESAASLRVFGILLGSGEAWFDEITVEEIPLSGKPPSAEIEDYIDEYFGLLRENTIITDTAHVNQLEKNARLLCAGQTKLEECHAVLKRYITYKLNDGHSFFSTPEEWKEMENGPRTAQQDQAQFVQGQMTDEGVAYLYVPQFVALDDATIHRYVDSTHALIEKLDGQNPKGWIIDISDNQGGNSFAMLGALGPILGNGICGYSYSGNGGKMTRIYYEGKVSWDWEIGFAKDNPYHIKDPDSPVAVIYGNNTGSSGEVVAISFRGRANTMSFGQETAGATTRIDNLRMSDGASFNLASGYNVDRNRVEFRGKVSPDRLIEDHDETVREAVRWIVGMGK